MAGQKGVHIFETNIVEGTALILHPSQELLQMPTLIADGDQGQAAFVSSISGKVGKAVRKGQDLELGHFQTSQEVKPCRRRSNKEISRPLQVLCTSPLVLLS